jgi:hypothetical protein
MKVIPKKNGTKTLTSEVRLCIGGQMFIAPNATEAAKVADLLAGFESVSKMEWHVESWAKYGDIEFFCQPHPVTIQNYDGSITVESIKAANLLKEKLTAEAQAEIDSKAESRGLDIAEVKP